MSGKQIQHIYHISDGGFAIYDHSTVITVLHLVKDEIVHIAIKKDSPMPIHKELTHISVNTPLIDMDMFREGRNRNPGVMPNYFAMGMD